MIPKGIYCYNENGLCPFFKKKIINFTTGDVTIYWCDYLNEGSIDNKINDELFNSLAIYHNVPKEELYNIYKLDLLWDQIKECGKNIGEDDEI